MYVEITLNKYLTIGPDNHVPDVRRIPIKDYSLEGRNYVWFRDTADTIHYFCVVNVDEVTIHAGPMPHKQGPSE